MERGHLGDLGVEGNIGLTLKCALRMWYESVNRINLVKNKF